MKQRELIKRLEKAGFEFNRHGATMTYIQEGQTQNRFRGTRK